MFKNRKKFIIPIIFVLLLIIGISYGYWTWNDGNKNIVFNTSKELQKYINYDEGESKFVGGVGATNNYTGGIHSTIAIKKTTEAEDTKLLATIKMDIKSIGNEMINSSALKWVITSGDSTNIEEVLNSGNFIGVNNGDTLTLLPSTEIVTTQKKYTIWIWLDASENPSKNLTMETLDTIVWTEINQR